MRTKIRQKVTLQFWRFFHMGHTYRVMLLCKTRFAKLYSLHVGTAQQLENEFCNLRPTLIPIDQPSYRHFPYYVTLYRCGGSDGYISPRYRACTPATSEEIKIKVRNLETSQFTEVIETNHTSCKPGCANKKEMCDTEMQVWNEQSCSCECRYPDGPPEACPERFK
jgi:hypothetical protein